MEPRMLDVGVPAPPWQASVKGEPIMVISTGDTGAGQEKAPSDGTYTIGDDGIPRRVRRGDPLPKGAKFTAKTGAGEAAPVDAMMPRGPSETTQSFGPTEMGAKAPTPKTRDK